MNTILLKTIWMLLALLCLVYAVIVYKVGSGTLSFVIWLTGVGFFLTAFLLTGSRRWRETGKRVKAVLYAIVIAALAVFAVCQIMIFSHFNDAGEKDLDAIIVLGAQMRTSGPSVIYQYRLDKAYEYLCENPDTLCIVSGAKGSNEPVSEGEGGKEYLVNKGINADRIIAEEEAVDTDDNIRNSLRIIENRITVSSTKKIGIVTNNYHVFRGVQLAKSMTDAEICGIAAYTEPLFLLNNLVRESFGIIRDIHKMILRMEGS